MKEKKGDRRAELPTIMIPFRDDILFAKKGGNEIYSFNTNSLKFKRVLGDADLTVAAMCSSSDRVFILNPKQPKYIRVLDSTFQAEGNIPTGLGDVRSCEGDISLIGDVDVNSSSKACKELSVKNSTDHTLLLSVHPVRMHLSEL